MIYCSLHSSMGWFLLALVMISVTSPVQTPPLSVLNYFWDCSFLLTRSTLMSSALVRSCYWVNTSSSLIVDSFSLRYLVISDFLLLWRQPLSFGTLLLKLRGYSWYNSSSFQTPCLTATTWTRSWSWVRRRRSHWWYQRQREGELLRLTGQSGT